MKIKLFLMLLLVSAVGFGQHKFLDEPKLSTEDLERTVCASDPEAAAEVLYRSYHYRIDYD